MGGLGRGGGLASRLRLLAFLLLLFPHGRLPSRRWRPFAWFIVAVYLTLSLSAALAPGAVELYYPEATPPVRLPVAGLADVVFGLLLPGQLLLLAVALVSVVLRLRRAPGRSASRSSGSCTRWSRWSWCSSPASWSSAPGSCSPCSA